jgi:hypothetical protein
MIDPQELQPNDIFKFLVVRQSGGSEVVTCNVFRDGEQLMRTPDIVQIHGRDAELGYEDDHLVGSIIHALPLLPLRFNYRAIVADDANGNPLKSWLNEPHSDPLERLTGRARQYCLNPAHPVIWSGITEVQFQVILIEEERSGRIPRCNENAPTEIDASGVPPIRSIALDLHPVPSLFEDPVKP